MGENGQRRPVFHFYRCDYLCHIFGCLRIFCGRKSTNRTFRSASVVGFAMVSVTIIDVFMFKNARFRGKIKWGQISARAQYALFFLAITFTWLMGLMGYVRAGLRQHWHVYGVMKDTSPDAFTPTLGFAAGVVSVTVLIFFSFIAIVFWLSGLSGKKNWEPQTDALSAGNDDTHDSGDALGFAKEAGA